MSKKHIKRVIMSFYIRNKILFSKFLISFFYYSSQLNTFQVDLIYDLYFTRFAKIIFDDADKLFNFYIDLHFENIMREYKIL